MPVYPWIPVTIGANSGPQVVASLRAGQENARPLCWSVSNTTFFAAIPHGGKLNYILGDVLLDFFGVTNPPTLKVILRLEDYHPGSNHREVQRMGDYLYSQGIPFGVSVSPWNIDRPGTQPPDFAAQEEFIRGLRYLQQRGGRLILKGVPFPESGHRLWDTSRDRPLNNEQLEALPARLRGAAQRLFEQGIFLLAWQTPDYSASRSAYRDIGEVFSTGIERVQLSDSTQNEKGTCGGITTDQHGRLVVPENAGYVQNTATNAVAEIRANVAFLKSLRGNVAGCYMHSYQPIHKLMELVTALEEFQAPFLDLADLDNSVSAGPTLLLSGQARQRVVLTQALVKRRVFDRNGKLVAEETEQERTSGERLFSRGKTGDYEIFEFRQ